MIKYMREIPTQPIEGVTVVVYLPEDIMYQWLDGEWVMTFKNGWPVYPDGTPMEIFY